MKDDPGHVEQALAAAAPDNPAWLWEPCSLTVAQEAVHIADNSVVVLAYQNAEPAVPSAVASKVESVE